MARYRLESFGPFLDGLQKGRESRSGHAPTSGGTSVSVLNALAEAPRRPIPLTDLQQASGMGFLDFSQAIQHLEDTGFVAIAGEPGRETAELTSLGASVVDVARTA